ncbi:Hypothetical protein SMAX5B_007045 [Scophthalmus maximus]|uniref:Uncharacterized protein n=1 Tax=Scophthalmus maximus TaxID=52904 RepID=A0A2U9B077_SCOMX|nr:Hypothetical protein SMAX5B_007045 [Scophthalmus maximus]
MTSHLRHRRPGCVFICRHNSPRDVDRPPLQLPVLHFSCDSFSLFGLSTILVHEKPPHIERANTGPCDAGSPRVRDEAAVLHSGGGRGSQHRRRPVGLVPGQSV